MFTVFYHIYVIHRKETRNKVHINLTEIFFLFITLSILDATHFTVYDVELLVRTMENVSYCIVPIIILMRYSDNFIILFCDYITM